MLGTNADIIIFGKIGHFQLIIPPSSTQLGIKKFPRNGGIKNRALLLNLNLEIKTVT